MIEAVESGTGSASGKWQHELLGSWGALKVSCFRCKSVIVMSGALSTTPKPKREQTIRNQVNQRKERTGVVYLLVFVWVLKVTMAGVKKGP